MELILTTAEQSNKEPKKMIDQERNSIGNQKCLSWNKSNKTACSYRNMLWKKKEFSIQYWIPIVVFPRLYSMSDYLVHFYELNLEMEKTTRIEKYVFLIWTVFVWKSMVTRIVNQLKMKPSNSGIGSGSHRKVFDSMHYAEPRQLLIYWKDQFLDNMDAQIDKFLSTDLFLQEKTLGFYSFLRLRIKRNSMPCDLNQKPHRFLHIQETRQ